jgi:hypothetical protein
VYNGNFDITKMLDQSYQSTQRCRLIFWVECSVGGYLALAKTICSIKKKCLYLVVAGENGNDLNYFGLYLNKSVMVIIIKIYDRDRFL